MNKRIPSPPSLLRHGGRSAECMLADARRYPGLRPRVTNRYLECPHGPRRTPSRVLREMPVDHLSGGSGERHRPRSWRSGFTRSSAPTPPRPRLFPKGRANPKVRLALVGASFTDAKNNPHLPQNGSVINVRASGPPTYLASATSAGMATAGTLAVVAGRVTASPRRRWMLRGASTYNLAKGHVTGELTLLQGRTFVGSAEER